MIGKLEEGGELSEGSVGISSYFHSTKEVVVNGVAEEDKGHTSL